MFVRLNSDHIINVEEKVKRRKKDKFYTIVHDWRIKQS